MNTPKYDLYQKELEELTGKIYSGDLTPLVYDLLKNTSDKHALLLYLGADPKPKPKEEPIITLPSFDKLFAEGIEVR